jgi:NitT/TauT family transport system ATP-binding protein
MLDQTSIPLRWLAFPKWRRRRREHLRAAAEFLDKVRLGDAMHLYPHELSGGMKQRVAIAQALIMKPEIILLDEPFGALDESTREELQKWLLHLYAENTAATKQGRPPPHTLVIVTHELSEAILVGDRMVALSQYWDWKGAGHEACPGATVVYDKACPIFEPHEGVEFEEFAHQREEVRRVAFDATTRYAPAAHTLYWNQS